MPRPPSHASRSPSALRWSRWRPATWRPQAPRPALSVARRAQSPRICSATGRAILLRSHMRVLSVARPFVARSISGATVARTLVAQARRCVHCLHVSARMPAVSAARPSIGASTWCATARHTRAHGLSPAGSVARALGAASMCCATSGSMGGRSTPQRVPPALTPGDLSLPGPWASGPPHQSRSSAARGPLSMAVVSSRSFSPCFLPQLLSRLNLLMLCSLFFPIALPFPPFPIPASFSP